MFATIAVVAFLGQMFLASGSPATAAPATAAATPATGTPAANNPAPFNPLGDLSSIIKNYNNANMLAWAGSKNNVDNLLTQGASFATSPFSFALAPFGLSSLLQEVPKGFAKAGLGIGDGIAQSGYGIINGLATAGDKAGQFTSPFFSMPQQFLGTLGRQFSQNMNNAVSQVPKAAGSI